MEQAELEKKIEWLEASVRNLLGPNPVLDEWIKHIREYESRLNNRVEALERQIAELEGRGSRIMDSVP